MKYLEYMAQFTLIDEAKPALIGRMKQRARQLRTAGASCAEAEASAGKVPAGKAAAISERRGPIRLHPIRWAAIFTSIALVLAGTPILAIFIPRGKVQVDFTELRLDYMKDLMVDTEGVTAYSIRRETVEEPAAASLAAAGESKGPAISFFPDLVAEKGGTMSLAKSSKKERTYLYSTTESYEAGNVEYDEAGIQKVTFMKNREVTEDVYDENGQLIDSNRRIEQDELDGQINRMYTTKRFTFVQFVPILESQGAGFTSVGGKTLRYEYANVCYRGQDGTPAYDLLALRPHGMEYDENGISSFDCFQEDDFVGRGVYFSSPFSASFVIDNTTGYFYKIEGFGISGFYSGLVVGAKTNWDGRFLDGQKSTYKLSVDADNNLVFTDIMPNKDILVKDAFTDNDGWAYVMNDLLDEIDPEKKIIYSTTGSDSITGGKYTRDAQGDVYIYSHVTDGMSILSTILTHKMVDGVPEPFENHGFLKLPVDLNSLYQDPSYFTISVFLGMYDDLAIYSGNNGTLVSGKEGKVGLVVSGAYYAQWFDDAFDMLLGSDENGLYYCPVDLAECVDKLVTYEDKDFVRFSDLKLERAEEYYLNVGSDRYLIGNVYSHKEVNETKYYRVVRMETGLGLEELTSKSYADNVFIFQPINK